MTEDDGARLGNPLGRCPEPRITFSVVDEDGVPVQFNGEVEYSVQTASGGVIKQGTVTDLDEIFVDGEH
jgi:hypothetical protein